MKYLTKEWYNLSQQTGLHFGMRVHKDAARKDEGLYLRLKKRKENEFIKMEREIYNSDPRFMLKRDGEVFVSANKFFHGGEIHEEDTIIYRMSEEEKDHINKLIEKYDTRAPFDDEKSRREFSQREKLMLADTIKRLPKDLLMKIADIRVFALGYCTKEILNQLKRYAMGCRSSSKKSLFYG
jgi:hypothetical protein